MAMFDLRQAFDWLPQAPELSITRKVSTFPLANTRSSRRTRPSMFRWRARRGYSGGFFFFFTAENAEDARARRDGNVGSGPLE